MKKSGLAISMMTVFGLSVAAQAVLAQNRMIPAVAFGDEEAMIQVVAKEEADLPGYVHLKYVVQCGSPYGDNLVDYYGPAIDTRDPELIQKELRFCKDDHDGDSSDNSGD